MVLTSHTRWWPFHGPAANRPARVLLLWWGSFPGGGGATIGDYHAVANVAGWLRDHDVDCEIMNGVDETFPGLATVGPDERDFGRYSTLAFVCGPLVLTHKLKRILWRFRDLTKVAVGISDLGDERVTRLFDEVIVRDGPRFTTFDLALANPRDISRAVPPRGTHPAICLRGMQKTYGKENCLSNEADSLICGAIESRFGEAAPIDTQFRPANGLAKIEREFAAASLVVTTRMHGALFALANRTPFVAVDQIRGGAKVSRLMQEIAWPWSYRVDRMKPGDLDRAIDALSATGWTSEMEERRTKAMELSRNAVDLAGAAIMRALDRAAYPTDR